MTLVESHGGIEIWLSADGDYYVYGSRYDSGDPCVVPSLAMARECAE
jgi:hypothetical protein